MPRLSVTFRLMMNSIARIGGGGGFVGGGGGRVGGGGGFVGGGGGFVGGGGGFVGGGGGRAGGGGGWQARKAFYPCRIRPLVPSGPGEFSHGPFPGGASATRRGLVTCG